MSRRYEPGYSPPGCDRRGGPGGHPGDRPGGHSADGDRGSDRDGRAPIAGGRDTRDRDGPRDRGAGYESPRRGEHAGSEPFVNNRGLGSRPGPGSEAHLASLDRDPNETVWVVDTSGNNGLIVGHQVGGVHRELGRGKCGYHIVRRDTCLVSPRLSVSSCLSILA